jgi:hypothetical protein
MPSVNAPGGRFGARPYGALSNEPSGRTPKRHVIHGVGRLLLVAASDIPGVGQADAALVERPYRGSGPAKMVRHSRCPEVAA